MITDRDTHTTANKKTSLMFLSGLFISVALFFLFVLSRLLRVDVKEMNDSAYTDTITSNRLLTPGTIYVTAYGGNTARLISGFTDSKWNHVALVGEDNTVHEISGGKIKTSTLSEWKEKWEDKVVVIIERKQAPEFNVNENVIILKNKGINVNVNPVFLSGLLVGIDFNKDTMYCTKFIKYILNEELPLKPGEYVANTDPILIREYHQPQAVRHMIGHQSFHQTRTNPLFLLQSTRA